MQTRVPRAWHFVCLLALAGVYALLAARVVYPGPYDYDESDYVFASRVSSWGQANDNPSLGLAQFINIGRSARGGGGERTELSQLIRSSNDVLFYRHWHGPFIAYWLLALKSFHLDETGMRRAGAIVPLLTSLMIYSGAVWISGSWLGVMAGFLGSSFYLWSYAVVRTSEITPHQMFSTFCLAALILTAKLISTGGRLYWYLAIVATALAFCTIEVAFVLVFTLACVAWVERRALRTDWGLVGKSILLFAGVIALAWPAALYKLSFLKAYAFLAYQAVYRKALWGEFTYADVWRNRLLGFPVEWFLITAAILAYLFKRDLPGRRALYPFLIFSGLMLLVMLRVNTTMPRYLLPFQPELLVFAGFVLAGSLQLARPWVRGVGVLALASALCANTALQNQAHPVIPDSREWEVLAFIRDHHLENQALIVPAGDLPTIHSYFPESRLRGYTGEVPMAEDFRSQQFAGVLFPDKSLHFELR